MGGRDDDTTVQREAQLRLFSSLPALRLQDSAERALAFSIAHHPVPEMRRSLRRDEWPEARQYVLRAALPRPAYTGSNAPSAGLPRQAAGFIETMDCLPVSKLPDGPEWTYEVLCGARNYGA
jgi:hypothetical protein